MDLRGGCLILVLLCLGVLGMANGKSISFKTNGDEKQEMLEESKLDSNKLRSLIENKVKQNDQDPEETEKLVRKLTESNRNEVNQQSPNKNFNSVNQKPVSVISQQHHNYFNRLLKKVGKQAKLQKAKLNGKSKSSKTKKQKTKKNPKHPNLLSLSAFVLGLIGTALGAIGLVPKKKKETPPADNTGINNLEANSDGNNVMVAEVSEKTKKSDDIKPTDSQALKPPQEHRGNVIKIEENNKTNVPAEASIIETVADDASPKDSISGGSAIDFIEATTTHKENADINNFPERSTKGSTNSLAKEEKPVRDNAENVEESLSTNNDFHDNGTANSIPSEAVNEIIVDIDGVNAREDFTNHINDNDNTKPLTKLKQNSIDALSEGDEINKLSAILDNKLISDTPPDNRSQKNTDENSISEDLPDNSEITAQSESDGGDNESGKSIETIFKSKVESNEEIKENMSGHSDVYPVEETVLGATSADVANFTGEHLIHSDPFTDIEKEEKYASNNYFKVDNVFSNPETKTVVGAIIESDLLLNGRNNAVDVNTADGENSTFGDIGKPPTVKDRKQKDDNILDKILDEDATTSNVFTRDINSEGSNRRNSFSKVRNSPMDDNLNTDAEDSKLINSILLEPHYIEIEDTNVKEEVTKLSNDYMNGSQKSKQFVSPARNKNESSLISEENTLAAADNITWGKNVSQEAHQVGRVQFPNENVEEELNNTGVISSKNVEDDSSFKNSQGIKEIFLQDKGEKTLNDPEEILSESYVNLPLDSSEVVFEKENNNVNVIDTIDGVYQKPNLKLVDVDRREEEADGDGSFTKSYSTVEEDEIELEAKLIDTTTTKFAVTPEKTPKISPKIFKSKDAQDLVINQFTHDIQSSTECTISTDISYSSIDKYNSEDIEDIYNNEDILVREIDNDQFTLSEAEAESLGSEGSTSKVSEIHKTTSQAERKTKRSQKLLRKGISNLPKSLSFGSKKSAPGENSMKRQQDKKASSNISRSFSFGFNRKVRLSSNEDKSKNKKTQKKGLHSKMGPYLANTVDIDPHNSGRDNIVGLDNNTRKFEEGGEMNLFDVILDDTFTTSDHSTSIKETENVTEKGILNDHFETFSEDIAAENNSTGQLISDAVEGHSNSDKPGAPKNARQRNNQPQFLVSAKTDSLSKLHENIIDEEYSFREENQSRLQQNVEDQVGDDIELEVNLIDTTTTKFAVTHEKTLQKCLNKSKVPQDWDEHFTQGIQSSTGRTSSTDISISSIDKYNSEEIYDIYNNEDIFVREIGKEPFTQSEAEVESLMDTVDKNGNDKIENLNYIDEDILDEKINSSPLKQILSVLSLTKTESEDGEDSTSISDTSLVGAESTEKIFEGSRSNVGGAERRHGKKWKQNERSAKQQKGKKSFLESPRPLSFGSNKKSSAQSKNIKNKQEDRNSPNASRSFSFGRFGVNRKKRASENMDSDEPKISNLSAAALSEEIFAKQSPSAKENKESTSQNTSGSATNSRSFSFGKFGFNRRSSKNEDKKLTPQSATSSGSKSPTIEDLKLNEEREKIEAYNMSESSKAASLLGVSNQSLPEK